MNLTGFLSMIIDKHRARKNAWRISERTLLIIAAAGGSIGSLCGMYLVRHKTQKRKFTIGIPLIIALQATLIILLFALHRRENTRPSAAVSTELDRIRQLDDRTISNFIDYQILTGREEAVTDNTALSPAALKAVHLFFSDFSYEITNEHEEKKEADVDVLIHLLDTRALAHDLRLSLTSSMIDLNETSPQTWADLGTYFELLADTLETHQYESITTSATFHLDKIDGNWVIDIDEQLQDEIVGGFGTWLTDPDLIAPDEILAIYLEKFGDLDADGWIRYFNMNDFFATGSTAKATQLDRTYAQRISSDFAWKIGSQELNEDGSCSIDVDITSVDLPAAAAVYEGKLTAYARTSESITSDTSTLVDKSAGFLIEALNENDARLVTPVAVTMSDEGGAWHLVITPELTNAFLGDLDSALEVLRQ